jgi:hypothetical protein
MKASTQIIFWLPRILCILAILFVSMFALDSFDPRLTIWQQIGGFIMHLIPSFILTLFLFVAWKWELAGGIIFALAGIGFTPFIYSHNYHMNHSVGMSLIVILMVTFPFVLVGGLFIASYWMKKKKVENYSQTELPVRDS